MTREIVVERRTRATPEEVYRHLTVGELWSRWQGVGADLDARPGGSFVMRMGNGMQAKGRFLELEPNRRVVFTWGWVDHPGVPPGSSIVEVDIIPDTGGTLIRLTHRGLPEDEVANHRVGWEHYFPRLAAAAGGIDPGPDPGPGG